MHRYVLIGMLAALLGVACSDDDKPATKDSAPPPDQKVIQKETGAPDQKVVSKETGAPDQKLVDKGSTPDAAGPAIKTNTIALIKALDKKLPTATTTDKVEKFVPTDKEATPWVEDTSVGKPGVESAYTDKGIELIINGHHANFAKEGTAGFAKQDYKTGKDTVQLFIWQMNKTTSAAKLFVDFKKEYETSWGLTFTTVSGVTTKAIIADDSPNWRVFGYRGLYFYELTATKGW